MKRIFVVFAGIIIAVSVIHISKADEREKYGNREGNVRVYFDETDLKKDICERQKNSRVIQKEGSDDNRNDQNEEHCSGSEQNSLFFILYRWFTQDELAR